MKLRYTDADDCPVVIETNLRELNKLIDLIEGVDGPYRALRSDLKLAREEAIKSAMVSFEYERKRTAPKVEA